MTTTSNQSGIYLLRLLVVMIAFVGLPSFPILILDYVPERFRWVVLLLIPFGFWFWSRLSRRLLVDSRYICPKCSKKIARMEGVERGDVGDIYLTCPACGFRKKSDDVAWHAPSG